MRGRSLAAAGALFAGIGAAGAFELPPGVSAMTAAEYDELGLFARAEVMEPIAKEAGVSYQELNACLKKAAATQELRDWKMPRATSGCLEMLAGSAE